MAGFSWADMEDAPQADPTPSARGGKFDWDSIPDHPDQSPGFLALASKINSGSNPLNQPADSMLADPEGTKMQAKIGAGLALGVAAGPMAEGAGIISRAGVNAGAAGLQKYASNLVDQKNDPTAGVIGNAAAGGALSVGVDALGGLYGGAKQIYQTGKWVSKPAQMQDAAIEAIGDATDKLKASESENLKAALDGKSVPIDTTKIRGISPEIDAILTQHAAAANPYGNIPSELDVPAEDANQIRRLLDSELSYKKLGPYAQSAEVAARDQHIKGLADQIRGQIHEISPDVSDTLDQWSDNLGQARNLDKRAETAPVTVLTSPSIDRRALLQKVDDQVGTKLVALGSQMNDAKNLSNAVHQIQPVKALGAVALTGAKGGFQAAKAGNMFSNPSIVQGLSASVSPSNNSFEPPSNPVNQVSPKLGGSPSSAPDIGSSPAKGADLWAQQGAQKLGLDDATAAKAQSDPKGKQLLIQASDMAPNSKAMKNILAQIQKGWGRS